MKTRSHRLQIWLLWAAMLPAAVQAQFTYTTNNDGSLNISRYTGSGGVVVIPSTTNGLTVTSIGSTAFQYCGTLTSVTIPNSVTSIGKLAFFGCGRLTNITIGSSVTNIGDYAFDDCALTSVTIPNSVTSLGKQEFADCFSMTSVTIGTNITILGDAMFANCTSLASVTIPNSITNIGNGAFYACTSLTGVTLGANVTSIGDEAFYGCSGLTGIYFQGNAPSLGPAVFYGDNLATVYYLPWTTGWGTPGTQFGGCPIALWLPQAQTGNASFGVLSNRFGFNITWASDLVIVVEASTDLANPVWTPVGTNTLIGGSSYFSDPNWTNYSGRFYRLRSQ